MSDYLISRLPSRIVAVIKKRLRADTLLAPDGNPVVELVGVPSAVNAVTITSAADGTGPTISGTDALNLSSDGPVNVNGSAALTSAVVHSLSAKATPVDSDELFLVDSDASFGGKKLTVAQLKALIFAYIVGAAPGTLDTLDELAAALGDDANFAATVTAALAAKASLTGAETLDNKTLPNTTTLTVKDAQFTLQDNADPTKQVQFELVSITTGNTRILYLPNGNCTLIGDSTTQTLTFKRINPRVSSTATGSSLTPTIASQDFYAYTALASPLTIGVPAGTPLDGNRIRYRFKDNGTGRALTWDAIFRAVGVTIPTTTTASKTIYVDTIYNAADTKWDAIDVKVEA